MTGKNKSNRKEAPTNRKNHSPSSSQSSTTPSIKQLQRAITNPTSQTLTPSVVMRLQRTHGNLFVQRLLKSANHSKSTSTIAETITPIANNPTDLFLQRSKFKEGQFIKVHGVLWEIVSVKMEEDSDDEIYNVKRVKDDYEDILYVEETDGFAEEALGTEVKEIKSQSLIEDEPIRHAYNEWEADDKDKLSSHEKEAAGLSKGEFVKSSNQKASHKNFRHITNPGNQDEKAAVEIDSGKVWALHGVDYVSGDTKRLGGFSFVYEGTDTDNFKWLQFLSTETIVDAGDAEDEDMEVDGSTREHPYYDPSSHTDTEYRMIDDPIPNMGTFNTKLQGGAEKVEQTLTFDTFLVEKNEDNPHEVKTVFYHGQIEVKFVAEARNKNEQGYPIKKSSKILKSGKATIKDLNSKMSSALASHKKV